MSAPTPGMEDTLSQAGSNRNELFRVIRHYQDGGDSLKLKAALFLIGNMADKLYFTGNVVDEFHTYIDSVFQIQQQEYDISAIYDKFREEAIYLKEEPIISQDVQTLSADYLIQNIEEAFAVWDRPWNRHLSFEDFCEFILPYRAGREIPESWRQLYRQRFEPLLQSDSIQTAKQACAAINNELINLPIHLATSSALPIHLRPSTLANIKFGLCIDYANLAVYAMRASGIPVAIENIPHWGHKNNGHTFNMVYDNDKIMHDFSGAEQNPDEHLIRFKNEIPKIYRNTFGKQSNSLAVLRGNEDVPLFFKNACMIDVTSNYPFIGAKDIAVPVPARTKRKFAYLCVFDTNGWIPVAWGNIVKDKAYFKDIGPNIVYHTALYANEKLDLVGNPFLLYTLGYISYYTPKPETIDYILERKKEEPDYLAYLPPLMLGSLFQGANNPEFRDAITLHTIHEEPNFKYITVTSQNTMPVKYVRYQASDKTRGNMAEVEFYTAESNEPLTGKVIGNYEPSIYYPRYGADVLFDGDPLTFFHSKDTLSWGGLELEKSTVISKIRFIIRNDDNGIRKGHEYELFYMDRGNWKSLDGKQIAAEDDRLLYKQIPQNALYWLHNHTKGIEERIFEIKDNTIIWH
jgi:hypothetical protein